MEHNQSHDTFRYIYSAGEQEELKRIRSKYMPREESKLDQLHRLDAGVTRKATMHSVTVGAIGALVLGIGMSLAMTDIGAVLSLGRMAMPIGIMIGIAGIGLMGIAYPIYFRVLKKERAKIAPEILRLTDELIREG